jgi:hypothetical protein
MFLKSFCLLPLFATMLCGAAPHALEVKGCVAKEGLLRPEATRGLPLYRRLVKLADAEGAYRSGVEVEGWSLRDVLERLKVVKKTDDGFDRPLDTFIVATGRDGRKALFSWSEVCMAADGGPLLVNRARLILPHKHDPVAKGAADPTVLLDPQGRDRLNLKSCATCHDGGHRDVLSVPRGLLLLAPQDGFAGRCVEDVATLEIRQVGLSVKADKAAGKKALVEVPDLVGPDGTRIPLDAARFHAGTQVQAKDATFGEGMGFHGMRHWTGADLGSILKPLLPAGTDPRATYVLITAADGYRSVFSGTEVFAAVEGRGTLLADRINGEPLGTGSGRYHAVPRADFYIDRDVRTVREIRLVVPVL